MTSLKFDVNLSVDSVEWAKRFLQSSPSDRAVMLTQVMDAFNDGEVGISLSFSEPVISESNDVTENKPEA